MEEAWTILKVLQCTVGYFSRKGIEQPRANAEVLLAHALGMERIELYLHYDQPLRAEELSRYREMVRRRAAREPTQYITGQQEFWSLAFEVTPSVLIPRPETELLVEKASQILGRGPGRVLDLGTGSGAIAIALAHECPAIEIIATDKSPDALEVAKGNALRHRVDHRIHFIAMDLLSGFTPTQPLFDCIVSNPPYIGEAEYHGLAPEIVHHEPEAALRGGGLEGLSIVRKILDQALPVLKPGGVLFVEIGQGQADILSKELAQKPGVESTTFIKDYSGILRVLHLSKANR